MPSEIGAVTVRSDGVLLRPWTPVDAAQVAKAHADPLIALWNPMNVASALEWCAARTDWRDGSHASWAIVEPTSPDLVLGSVSVFHIEADHERAEIGYWVTPDHRRRGVGGRAVQAATTFAFGALALRRVVLFHAVDNDGSCGVARNAGYLLEGVHRQGHRYGDGRWHDEHSHARLRSTQFVGEAGTTLKGGVRPKT